MNIKITILAVILLLTIGSLAQSTINGKVLDQETLKPISNVNINVVGMDMGTTSNQDGSFSLTLSDKKAFIEFSSIGYKANGIVVNLNYPVTEIGVVYLEPQPYSLDEISINAGLEINKELPVSVSSISSRTIENDLGDRPLPMVMQSTPGVFSVRVGGGSGDSRLSIRGFHQENVSLLLNGIPANGDENGLVYWNNWLGLSYAAAEIQIQKGPGLANASINAIGGTVNIITKNSDKEKSGTISFSTTDYGNFNSSIVLNSGLLKNGWNTSLMLSYGSGKGYVDATNVTSMAYFFTASKSFNEKHKIVITLLGAPERHGQRNLKLSNDEVSQKGLKFNKDWGSLNGQTLNASENFYHKPFFSINDEFKIDDKNLLSTSIYLSGGYGGGRWSESFNYAPSIFSYRNYSGQIDWDNIYENNATNQQTYLLDNGEIVSGYSHNVLTKFLASHVRAGIVSNYEHRFSDKLKIQTGLHYKYFNSYVREEIDDLMGGQFFIEDYSWSLAGVAGREQIKTVGDIIKVDNNTVINFASAWGQLVYNTNRINTFISASVNNNWYTRIDRYNYITNTESETVLKPGFDLRTGIIWTANEFNSIYINGSYISKAPYFKYVFGNFTNVVVKDLKNETAASIELGYKLKYQNISANLTGFITQRKDISMLSNEYVQLENNSQTRAMITGLNSINSGIELDFNVDVSRSLRIGGWASMGSFLWQNNVTANLFNDNNVIVDTVNVFVDGLAIGGTAKNQVGVFADITILKTLFLKTEYQYFDGVYADFDPTNRNDITDMEQPYRFPSYGILNAYLGIPFSIKNNYGRLQVNIYNILNNKYIIMGEDGLNHNLESFRGFWSFGRNISFGLTFNF